MSLYLRQHRHAWVYQPRGIGGWGVVVCAICKKQNIY